MLKDFYWRDYNHGEIPCDAMEAAPGRYIGQAYHHGNIVATIYPFADAAVIESSGRRDIRSNVKILCSNHPDNLYWEKVNFGKAYDDQMTNIVKGGYDNEFLFIGKAHHESEWKIGKVVAITHPNKGLWLWDTNRKAVNLKEFHVLKYNTSVVGRKSPECYTRTFLCL